MRSPFGNLSLHLQSGISENRIDVTLQIDPLEDMLPEKVTLRIPHPQEKKATCVSEGLYDPDAETITLPSFQGQKNISVYF